jgi:hypothetical protein
MADEDYLAAVKAGLGPSPRGLTLDELDEIHDAHDRGDTPLEAVARIRRPRHD